MRVSAPTVEFDPANVDFSDSCGEKTYYSAVLSVGTTAVHFSRAGRKRSAANAVYC